MSYKKHAQLHPHPRKCAQTTLLHTYRSPPRHAELPTQPQGAQSSQLPDHNQQPSAVSGRRCLVERSAVRARPQQPNVFSPLYVMYRKPSSSLWSSYTSDISAAVCASKRRVSKPGHGAGEAAKVTMLR